MDNAPSQENANCAGSTTRRTVLKGVGGLTLGSLASGSFAGSRTFSGAGPTGSYAPQAPPPAPSDRPNNVYFTVDNLGMGELGCHGGGILLVTRPGALAPISDPGTRHALEGQPNGSISGVDVMS